MAYQMVQTPVILNDPESHFSYPTLLTHFLETMTRSNCNMCTRIGEHMWPVTLNKTEDDSAVSELFKCKSSTFVQHFTRFQLACLHRMVPQRQLGFSFGMYIVFY